MFGLFHTDNLLPSAVYIDHTMTVHYKHAGHDSEANINSRIQQMLDNLYGAPIVTANPEIFLDNELDFDGVLNPGEGFSINFTFTNNSFETDAINAIASLSTEDGGTITSDATLNLGDIYLGSTVFGEFSIMIENNVDFGSFDLHLNLSAEYINSFGELDSFSKDVPFSVTVSLNQTGFPLPTAELKASPLVIDIDSDGEKEIILGDNNGFIRIYNADGSEVINDTFPFDTGNQIWGSAAAADMDVDGIIDFVINSKSKHLYIFDKNGLKVDYYANKYLMGTPAIGNLDDDDELEVVIGGYSSPSSSNTVFVINADGTDVEGFPLVLGEKIKAGIALADYNNNGKDDMIIGTDDDKVHLIYDDGTSAPGFPFIAGDKFQASPAMIDIEGDKIIFAGSNDNNMYAINSDGSLRFTIETGDKVLTSPSFLEYDNNIYVFFGSNDNKIYAVDHLGNALSGWPIDANAAIEGSVVFSDLDGDNMPEIIAANNSGELLAFHIDGSHVDYFPIVNDFPFSGSPMVTDLDGDGDLEIFAGTGGSLFVLDFKDMGSHHGYWNLHRNSVSRNGCRFYSLNQDECNVSLGDVTGDGNVNILDLVQIANLILGISIPAFECAADFTLDGNINILDLVQIANYILES